MKPVILILLISSCCSNTVDVHKDLKQAGKIDYIKLDDNEKKCIPSSGVIKIHANKTACDAQINEINAIIQAHNKAHGDK